MDITALSSPLFSLFLAHFFFFCWVFSRLHFGGKVFREGFRILGLDERKGRWAVEQDFHGNFQVNVTRFFAFFSGVRDWIVPLLVWFERSLHFALHSLTIKTDDVTSSRRDVDPLRWLRAAQGRICWKKRCTASSKSETHLLNGW